MAIQLITRSLLLHFSFAMSMSGRELRGLTKGAALGLLWLVLKPLIQVAAYVTIVTVVFSKRSAGGVHLEYLLYVLSGNIGWQLMQRSLEDATGLIRERVDIVRQLVYPVETLPLTSLLSSFIGPGVALLLFLILAAVDGSLETLLGLHPTPEAVTAKAIPKEAPKETVAPVSSSGEATQGSDTPQRPAPLSPAAEASASLKQAPYTTTIPPQSPAAAASAGAYDAYAGDGRAAVEK